MVLLRWLINKYCIKESFLSLIKDDWTGRSLYDLVHPEDVAKIREQLSSIEAVHLSNGIKMIYQYHIIWSFAMEK